ncbi:MAG: hypothetical protein ACQCN4_06655 [Candidatus Bathyarchaeia archaeon]|jgi:formylmethanofuran dehydrogenase subunit B
MVEQKLRATLITGRTIEQGVGKEMGKGSIEYFDNCAVCILDKSDMVKLGVKNGSTVPFFKGFPVEIEPAPNERHVERYTEGYPQYNLGENTALDLLKHGDNDATLIISSAPDAHFPKVAVQVEAA